MNTPASMQPATFLKNSGIVIDQEDLGNKQHILFPKRIWWFLQGMYAGILLQAFSVFDSDVDAEETELL